LKDFNGAALEALMPVQLSLGTPTNRATAENGVRVTWHNQSRSTLVYYQSERKSDGEYVFVGIIKQQPKGR
jgi:hypothetical protein